MIFTLLSLVLMGVYGFDITHYHLIAALSFVISSWCLTPDLDTLSIPRKRWWFFGMIWKPFTHRGILHSPTIAPIILTLPVTIVILCRIPQFLLDLELWYNLVGIYAGITAQIEVHILADKVIKKRRGD